METTGRNMYQGSYPRHEGDNNGAAIRSLICIYFSFLLLLTWMHKFLFHRIFLWNNSILSRLIFTKLSLMGEDRVAPIISQLRNLTSRYGQSQATSSNKRKLFIYLFLFTYPRLNMALSELENCLSIPRGNLRLVMCYSLLRWLILKVVSTKSVRNICS